MQARALNNQSLFIHSRFNSCVSACLPSKASSKNIRSKPLNQPNKHNNTLIDHALSDDNLDAALEWLRNNSRHNDYSDVWSYCRDWDSHKSTLRQRIKTNNFRFQAVQDVEVSNEQGKRRYSSYRSSSSYKELRCAEDRILVRALAQVLKPIVKCSNT